MFKRVTYEDWVLLAALTSFIMVAAVFLVGMIRALRLSKADRDRLSALPLDDSSIPSTHEPSTTPHS
ncbi:MAG: hypothetical protein RLZZ522_1025 [Verrucomicrobiota bacterium]